MAIAGALLIATSILVYVLPLPADVRVRTAAILFLIPIATSCIAAVRAASRARGTERAVWVLLALSSSAFLAAWIYRAYWVYTQGRYAPTGSFEDVAILTGFLLLVAAAIMVAVGVRLAPMRLLRSVFDMLATLLLAAAIAYWLLLSPLDAFRPGGPTFVNVALAAYPIFGIGLVIFALAFGRSRRTPWARFFIAGLAAGGVAAAGVIATLASGRYSAGDPLAGFMDALIMTAFVLFTLAGVARVDPAYAPAPQPVPFAKTPKWTGVTVSLVGLAGVPLLVWLAVTHSAPAAGGVFGTGAAVIAALLIGRNIMVIAENRSLVEAQSAARRYETVIEGSPSGILVVDSAGKFIFGNNAAAELAEAESVDDLIGRSWPEFSDPEMRDEENETIVARYLDEIAEVGVAAGTLPARTAVPHITLKGRRIWVDRTLTPINYEGKPAVLAQFVDATARIEAERASEEYRARLGEMTADLLATEDREQRRFSEALHDEVSQPLAMSRMHMSAGQASGAIVGAHADESLRLLDMAIARTRSLTSQLAPPFLAEFGLRRALEWLADEFAETYGLNVTVSGEIDENALDQDARAALFRTVRELLNNVVKHACVDRAEVTLGQSGGYVCVTVSDDGAGLHEPFGASGLSSGFGLLSIRERLPRLGGEFEFGPGPDGGVRATAKLPMRAE